MFSIVIPLWNKRDTVAGTVARVLAQTWRDFELIIVDDGSTDGGMDRLEAFRDERIRRLVQANAGPGAARNRGIEAARHDWIALLDADDLWLPGHLAELDRIRLRYPRSGLIGTSFICSSRSGNYREPPPGEGRIEAIDCFDLAARRGFPFCTSSVAIARSSYLAFGGFGEARVAQDIEYWVKIAIARPVAISSRTTAVYRLGTGGISDTTRSPWFGRQLREARDLDPSVALLLDRYPSIAAAGMRESVDRYIDSRFRDCARRSARIGDLRALRSLPLLYLRPPPPVDRLILAIARLPAPVAAALYGIGFALKALARRVKAGARARRAAAEARATPAPAPTPGRRQFS